MDTAKAFIMAEKNRYKEPMIFDWHKAAKIIKERNPFVAAAGLQGDTEYTGGVIYEDENIVTDSNTYLASTWAVPLLFLHFGNTASTIPCYIMERDNEFGWDAQTVWPQSALGILNKEVD